VLTVLTQSNPPSSKEEIAAARSKLDHNQFDDDFGRGASPQGLFPARQRSSASASAKRTGLGVKVSVATTMKHSAGSSPPMPQHWPAIPMTDTHPQHPRSLITDAGYRGHNAPPDHKFKVYTSGQKRRLTPQIKREFKRRAAIEPLIGPINAVLAAAGYNFRRLLAWLRLLSLRILIGLGLAVQLKLA
jgi:hypothetical protein